MDRDVVIHAEGLGKRYIIGHQAERERYVTLRDVIARAGRNVWRRTTEMARGRTIVRGDAVEEFWALRNLDFEVRRGEVLGIIGRNGAGKSTLLKILSRITEPTEGRVLVKGRVASLLEVGTGFHPELTGRENIFLNGAILGMTRAEIRRKFDEIVAFADVELFLDTPVKRYSSGMYVRLAFAVAAHLEPEILVVDEVLAVGDAEFQKKCLGKMQDVAGHGRTVLFVSHQLGMLARLCGRAILLEHGSIQRVGDAREVLSAYKNVLETQSNVTVSSRHSSGPHISNIITLSDDGDPSAEFFFDEAITIRVTVEGRIQDPRTLLTTTLVGRNGDYVTTATTPLQEMYSVKSEKSFVYLTMPDRIIAPNDYYFRVALFVPPSASLDLHELACPIKIRDSGSIMSEFEGMSYGHVILSSDSRIDHHVS